MKKAFVIGAVVVCAAAAGGFGVYTVEKSTEAAVAEALSAVPAKAREIRYSFLENTLVLKGVEYEVTSEGLERSGSIESVEVKGFNRRYVFTKSDAPYSPETLPVVAESISVEGVDDKVTLGRTGTVEQKVKKVLLTGWYQRLGTLLSLHREHSGEEAFFEEMYRCRIDGMEASDVTMTLSESDMTPVTISVGRMALLEGVHAPAAGEKVSPVSLGFFGLSFSGKDVSGGLKTLELRDILMPEPEILAAFLSTAGKLDAVDEEELFGEVGDKLVMDMDRIIRRAYEDKVPVGRMFMEGGSLSMRDASEEKGGKPSVFSMTMKSFDYRLSETEKKTFRYGTELSGLTMNFPETMEEADILSRYAPKGLTLNVSCDSVLSRDAFSGSVRYELEGLGVLEGDMAMLGDIRRALDSVVYGGGATDMDALMNRLRLKNMHVVYQDSGLLAMAVEIAARWGDSPVESVLEEGSVFLQRMAQEKERPVRELGTALLAMYERPGRISMTVSPEQPMNVTEAITLASLNPDALPLSFSAEPGNRPLRDYLPKP